jgi:putative PIN family toxin of toxin-antitoxin system
VRVFLDTNVLASALATRGLCSDVLQAVLAEHELVVGIAVIEELREILPRKFHLPPQVVAEFLSLIKEQGILVSKAAPVTVKLRDRGDRRVLANALAGDSDVFVTGDKELIALGRVNDVPIVSPRDLWTLLRK